MYALDMLLEVGMLKCKAVDIPTNPNLKLLPDKGELLEDQESYKRLIGKLNYLTMTRSDIAYQISVVSQFRLTPRMSHLDVVVKILQSLKSVPGRGLMYSDCGYNHDCDRNHVAGFSDADWAGCPIDRRSTTLYVY